MLKQLLIASIVAGACAPAFAASLDPNNAIGLTPDQIVWKKGEANDTAWPIGDPAKPGMCLELIKWHPNHFSRPHYHSHARYAVVIDGTWWVSTSNVYDPEHNTIPYPKGSVLTDLVKGVHYDGAKPETGDGTVAIFMDCPLESTPAEVKK
jgi:hypothetical protein